MPRLIIGLVGQAGAGKGTAAKFIHDTYHAQTFTFSDILSDILDRMFLEHSRDNMIKISMALREAFGQDVLSNTMEKQVRSTDADVVIVDGIRRMDDIADLQGVDGFHLIEIHAPDEVRFNRLKNRNEKEGEADMTWEDFVAMSKRETEMSIAGVAARAEAQIDNSLDLNALKAKIDALLIGYLKV